MAEIARTLARFIVEPKLADFPANVRREGPRALVNWTGCALGSSHDPAIDVLLSAIEPLAGPGQAILLGRKRRLDLLHAVLINCMAGSVRAYDDAHLVTLAHPSGPAVAAALAIANHRPVKGRDLLAAIILGIEVQCRMSNVLSGPGAKSPLGLYMTGFTGGMGAAAAAGKLLGLTETQMMHALGTAAAQGGGFRAVHGSMTNGFVRGNAARSGMAAALYAAQGFTCMDNSLDGPNGFAEVLANPPNLAAATDGLGRDFAMLGNTYKPYPCGVPVHPTIDVSLDLAEQLGKQPGRIKAVELRLDTSAFELCSRPNPASPKQALVSVQHWAAAALVRHAAGIDEGEQSCIDDPQVAALRRLIKVREEPGFGRDEAAGSVTLDDGRVLRAHIAHCRGSLERPLTDAEIETKFIGQARIVMPAELMAAFVKACWSMADVADVGRLLDQHFA